MQYDNSHILLARNGCGCYESKEFEKVIFVSQMDYVARNQTYALISLKQMFPYLWGR
ncbi:hypothetical protein K457DRAFT_131987 [Linnemannia elongata AG-77]|uniref:Uncharacterized protein n=1 Tax=Linnemannia elongata AG-77 TaxID=1314771 RepID=A0A197KIA7_9FUNG|nr:hypothetical protein K457DRAFT_131987 [Linnemannia elongata AG-77]